MTTPSVTELVRNGNPVGKRPADDGGARAGLPAGDGSPHKQRPPQH